MIIILQTINDFFAYLVANHEYFDFGTMLIAALSALFAFKAYKNQRNRAKKAAACELAKYYADNIIKHGAYIETIYSECGYAKLIKETFSIDAVSSFTQKEMLFLLEQAEKDLDTFFQGAYDVQASLILKYKLIFSESDVNRSSFIRIYNENTGDNDSTKITNTDLLVSDFECLLNNLLNELEWFSMQCRYGIADEKLLYQSLHQTFLSVVQLLYFHISHRNINSEDKFYTNLIWLFQTWKARLKKYKKKNQSAQEKAHKKVEKARKAAERAGQVVHHGKPI